MNYRQHYIKAIEELTGKPVADSDGIPASVLDECPFALPQSLKDYYCVVGNHKINTEHNQLYSPSKIKEQDGYLVFAEENQGVVIWGIPTSDNSTDPIVFQGQEFDNRITWYSEDMPFSRFIIAMWKWQREEMLRTRPNS